MGTRSLTVLMEGDLTDNEIAVLYRQYDGYPSGHGKELQEFLEQFVIVNGIGKAAEGKVIANGPNCLAAQIIANFKTEPGGFYLYPAKTRDAGEEWTYYIYIYIRDNGVRLRVEDMDSQVRFDGPVEVFDPDKAEDSEQVPILK